MAKDWLNWDEAYQQEEEIRLNTDFKTLCTYGITPLDDPLLAITKNELVVIGADSGVGKSSLILDIARHNARKGKKVALYYLEGGHIEAIQKMKWKDICEFYYKERRQKEYKDMDFRRWSLNIGENLTSFSSHIYTEQKELYKNKLFFYPISEGFTIDDLISSLLDFHSLEYKKDNPFVLDSKFDLDLVIIDHLQYFSLTQAENEINEITKIIREAKKITDHYNIPIIIVSHLRKKNRDRGLPDQEDFYGSSNIPKIATTAITISSYSQKDDLHKNIFPSFFRIVKSRIGIRPNYALLCNYDLNQRKYADQYEIYKLDGMGNILPEPLAKNELPNWACNAERINKDDSRPPSTD